MDDAVASKPTGLGAEERLARLRLIRSENVGPVTFRRLLERFGDARRALDALPELARRGGRKRSVRICERAVAEDEMAALARLGAVDLHRGEPGYPPLLALIDDAPPVLFVRGHARLLQKRAVAVVGSRNASLNGRRFAGVMARALGEAGYMVASGMARGIDAAAHEGALATGTLAVLGGGVDVVYPREHQALYDRLLDEGAVCSEVSCGTTPQARHFPRRNRIISGVARAIVVLEAGARSGSLITARMALEQGREVFAVPGPPQDPRVKGANMLIREGAYLTECAADVTDVLAGMRLRQLDEDRAPGPGSAAPETVGADETADARERLHDLLDYGPTEVDALIRESGHRPAVVATVLLELELAGRLERHAGNKVALLAGG